MARGKSAGPVTPGPALVLVSAGVLIERGRVLLSQRKVGTHLAGAWEFPGGKVEPGEDPRAALARELKEEVGIDVNVGDILEATFHVYRDAQGDAAKAVLLLFYRVTRAEGSHEPTAIDVAAVSWAGLADLDASRFPAADVDVLGKVRALLAT
jgi:8-oxo-dGTP diphosphatase